MGQSLQYITTSDLIKQGENLAAEFELKAVMRTNWFVRRNYRRMASNMRLEIAELKLEFIDIDLC